MTRSKLWDRLMKLRRKALKARSKIHANLHHSIRGQVLLPRPSL